LFAEDSIKRLIEKLLVEECHLINENNFHWGILGYFDKSPNNFQQSFSRIRIRNLNLNGIPAVSIKHLIENEIAGN
jgi:hypothetical protein